MNQTKWLYIGDGVFELHWGEAPVLSAHAEANHIDGRYIDTREAELTAMKEEDSRLTLTFEAENGLVLTEHLCFGGGRAPTAWAALSTKSGEAVETRCLMPLVLCAARQNTLRLWKSLWTKMLLVPYDNTMWLRYEAQPLRAGRKSCDMTVLFMEDDREGLLIGAADFSTWKNALICSAADTKVLYAKSGAADAETHDTEPHGSVRGSSVESSRFYVLYGKDYRKLLEEYGDLIAKETTPLPWRRGVPFGFNSWAGLAFRLDADNFRASGRFLRETLMPLGYQGKSGTYVNLDAGWSEIPENVLVSLVEELHENGQKAGIYDAPFAFFGQDANEDIPGAAGHRYEEILLRDASGNPLPRVDGAIPLDVTHPVWKQQMKWKLDRFVQWGFDYVKLDFLSHGGMEGCRYDSKIRTGRQAISAGYEFLNWHLNEERIGRPFFISHSIAPLFPNGHAHARRFSCDAFGTNEDIEYVLNAQTYAWWQSGRLFAFNDPDHICLLRSFCMDRDSTEGEARARYTASVIAGTVMMLSDDYTRPEAKERASQFAGNREINQVAAKGISFRPVESGDASAAHVFTAVVDGRQYVALFHWKNSKECIHVDCARAGLRTGTRYRELWSGETLEDKAAQIRWTANGCDAALLKEMDF